MRKWYWLITILLLCVLLFGINQTVQAAPPPPTEETPQPVLQLEAIDPALMDAFDKNVNSGSKQTGEVLAFVIYDPYIDHVVYSADGQIALLWLGLHDPDTGEVIAAEPGLAIAKADFSQKSLEDGSVPWEITQQADENWQEVFSNLPLELQTEDLIQRFQVPDDVVSKDVTPPYRGYKLPWAGGLSKTLSGSIGHFLIYNSCNETNCRYAYDFADGTMFPLLASRGGTVFRVATSCPNYDTSCNNYIVLKDESTSPTTYQLYLHMAYNSVPTALRTIGASVVQGQFIGNVDDTGYSSGHHLHFHVHTNATSYWGISVDVRFDDVSINDGTPRTCYEATTFPNYGTGCIRDDPNTSTNELNKFRSGNYGAYPPTGDLIMPSHGQEISEKSVLVGGWARDDIGIQKVQIIARGRGEDWKVISADLTTTNTSFLADINLCDAGVSNGPVDIAARIYDFEGNLIVGGMTGLRTILNNASCSQIQPPVCIPTADQVALYTDANYQGTCATFNVGDYLDAENLGILGDNTVESLMVGSNVRAIIYDSRDWRNEAFEVSDANLRDNRVVANYVSGLKVQTRSTLPVSPSISTIFNDVRKPLSSSESYVIDFVSLGAVSFRAELSGPVNKTLSETRQNGWSVGSLPAGNYTVRVWGKNSAGERENFMSFNIGAGSLSNNTSVNAPVTFDFESGTQNWEGIPMWYRASMTLGTRTSNVWMFNDNYAGTGANDLGDGNIGAGDLTSQPIHIPSSGYYLRFDYYYQTESFYTFWDHRWVQISVDGAPFENLVQLSMDPEKTWLTSQAINLSAYAGKTIRIRFHMDIVDRYYNGGYLGWAVDNIAINNTAPVSCTDVEPNNSIAQAVSLAVNNQVSAFICPGGDLDFYKINLSAGQQITLDVDAKVIGSSLDSYLFLYDSLGNLILENDDVIYSVERDSRIYFSPTQNGTYYAMIKAWDHPKAGSSSYFYTLKVSSEDLSSPTVDFIVPNSSLIPSTTFPVQAAASDTGSGVQKVDFYWRNSDILNGLWVLLGSDTNGLDGWSANFNPASYIPVTNGFLFIQAFDNNNNQDGSWRMISGFDTGKPVSQLNPIPGTSYSTLVRLSWTGSDPDGVLGSYDLQYQVNGGTWTDYLTGIPASQTTANFFGDLGKNYGFRLRARDLSNNLESYPTSAETSTSIATCSGDGLETSDNSTSGAGILAVNMLQNHNFCPVNDVDWVKVNLLAGKEYLYMVSSKGGEAGMKVQLYASNQTTLLKEMVAPGFGQSVAFKYTPSQTQTGYMKITPLDNRLAGNNTQYSVWYGEGFTSILPLIFK